MSGSTYWIVVTFSVALGGMLAIVLGAMIFVALDSRKRDSGSFQKINASYRMELGSGKRPEVAYRITSVGEIESRYAERTEQ